MKRFWFSSSTFALCLLSSLWACAPVLPPNYVHRLPAGSTDPWAAGESLKVQHLPSENLSDAKPGYVVVKSLEEWNGLFANGALAKPPQIDWSRKMVIFMVSDWAGVVSMGIDGVVESGTRMHIYATEGLPGEGCPVKNQSTHALDAVVVDRSEKPVHFYLYRKEEVTCGAAPEVKMICKSPSRLSSETEEQAVKPGELVECDANVSAKGKFAVVNTTWSLKELPPGSATKMQFFNDGNTVKFHADVVGRYGLKVDVTDEGGRHSIGEKAVFAKPAKMPGVYMQLGWSGFDASDDTSTFPRVVFEGYTLGSDLRCSAESGSKPSWCDLHSEGINTSLSVPSLSEPLRLRVRYIDDRYNGGAFTCFRMYHEGNKTAELCDSKPRKAGEVWTIGEVSVATGTLDSKNKAEQTEQASEASGEGGAKREGTSKDGKDGETATSASGVGSSKPKAKASSQSASSSGARVPAKPAQKEPSKPAKAPVFAP